MADTDQIKPHLLWRVCRKIIGTTLIFVAGSDFERLGNGGVDSYFGTRWLLVVFMLVTLLAGMGMLQARPPCDRVSA